MVLVRFTELEEQRGNDMNDNNNKDKYECNGNKLLAGEVSALEKRVAIIEKACCSKETIERDVKVDMLIKDINKFIDTAKQEMETLNARADRVDKLIYITIGIILAIEFLGLDKAIVSLLKGVA